MLMMASKVTKRRVDNLVILVAKMKVTPHTVAYFSYQTLSYFESPTLTLSFPLVAIFSTVQHNVLYSVSNMYGLMPICNIN